jgi:hypothetical protein
MGSKRHQGVFCKPCAVHNHQHCVGPCDCGHRKHNPDVRTAAAMRMYERPDLRTLSVEKLATSWHQKDEQQHAV